MTSSRVLDTHRLSILAAAYEREIVQLLNDLAATNGTSVSSRIRREMEKVGFAEIRTDSVGNVLGRIGSGSSVILVDSQLDPSHAGDQRAGLVSLVYAGKLIHEMGMEDDYTLWARGSIQHEPVGDLHPDCVLITEPTSLRIHRGITSAAPGESHPLVKSAIETYEALFELPPLVGIWPCTTSPTATPFPGVPTIGFGPGDGCAPVSTRHLLQAAQFYATFPQMYVDAVGRR